MLPYLNNVNQTLIELFRKFFLSIQRNNSRLISFLRFSELFPPFNWAKGIGNLLNIWLGISIFSSFPDWISLLNSRILSIISIIFSFSLILLASSLGVWSTILCNFLKTFLIESTRHHCLRLLPRLIFYTYYLNFDNQ